MSVVISPSTGLIVPSGTLQFTASDGVAPYTWTVLGGGVGGSVDGNGLYTAPASPTGFDTVRVTDDNGDFDDAVVTVNNVLTIYPSFAAMKKNLTKPFTGIGGTPPYTYAATLGSINGSGVYTSPNSYGVATITVTDSLSVSASATVSILSYLELFCEIIQRRLGLANGRVYLWDQKIMEPKDMGLFVVVGIQSLKPFANTRTFDENNNSIQSSNWRASLSVDIISRDNSAIERKEEVLMALKSIYSEQQQQANSFYIAPLSESFTNLSDLDGTAIPYRFNMTVGLQYFEKLTVNVDYFDEFDLDLKTNA